MKFMEYRTRSIDNGDLNNELLEYFKAGDEQAFAELYRHMWAKVYHRLRRLNLPDDQAEDGVQCVFEKLAKKADGLHTQNVSGWLMVVAHNYAMDYHRKKSTQDAVISPVYPDEIELAASTQPEMRTLETAWGVQDIISQVRSQYIDYFDVNGLDDILRMIAGGDSYKYIADTLGVPEQTVKSRIHRLKVRLADSAFTADSLD